MEIPWATDVPQAYAKADRKRRQMAALSGLIGVGANRLQAVREGKGLLGPTDATERAATVTKGGTDPDAAQAELEARLGVQQEQAVDESKSLREKTEESKGGFLRQLAGGIGRGASALLGSNP